MKTLALIALALAPLAACSTGNDRTWVGNPDLSGGAMKLDAIKDPGRPEAPTAADSPSLTGISRNNWTPLVITVPVDSTAATRTYTVNYMWTDATARQRGQMPSTVSALELSGDSDTDQALEAAASGPLAVIGSIMIIPRMITHSPFTEVRYFPESYWRAPATTLRKPLEAAPAPSDPSSK